MRNDIKLFCHKLWLAWPAWSEIGHVTYIKLKGLSIEYLSVSSKVPLRTVFLKNRFEGQKMAKKSKIGQKRIDISRYKSRDTYQCEA